MGVSIAELIKAAPDLRKQRDEAKEALREVGKLHTQSTVDIVECVVQRDELLEALKAAFYCLETVAENEGFDTSVGVVPQARAAIANAERRKDDEQ
jgi:hypothetical protein